MKNKKTWAIAVLLMTVASAVFVYANDNRRVAVIPQQGTYHSAAVNATIRLTWSGSRGEAGTFMLTDTRNNRNWASGTYRVAHGVISMAVTSITTNGDRDWIDRHRGRALEFDVINATTFSNGGEVWRFQR